MKKYIILILAVLSISGLAHAESFPYLFAGKWQPSEDPLLIGENGFQDIQNMRKDGKRLRGVNGHTRTTTGIVNATYKFIKNGFHFTKDQPEESHVLVWSANSANTASRVYQNTTAIPDVGDFSATALHTNASDSDIGLFSNAPQGNVLYANGEESMIWGGNGLRTAAFITASATITTSVDSAKDYSQHVNNTGDDADQVATVDSAGNKIILVGSVRPLQGITFSVSSANVASSFSGAKYWNGAWAALTTVVDTTTGLSTDGSITFDSTVADATTMYLEGFILYWYQFELDGGSAKVSYVTVDAPWQKIKNIWDGSEEAVGNFQLYDGTTYNDYTDEINDDTTEFVATLDALTAATDKIYIGFATPQQAVNIRMKGGEGNSNASVLTVKYWNGAAWTAVSNMVDGTKEGGATFAKTGVINWSSISAASEFKTSVADEVPLYYYQLTVSANFSASVESYYVTGFYNPSKVKGYRFPGEFQGRAFLFSEKGGEQNKAIYSSSNAPDVWDGPDTGALYFGDEKKLTSAGRIYNIFKTTGLDQLIVTKQHETWRVFGNGPDNWEVQQMSSNVGNVAPRSAIVAEISDFGTGDEVSRHVMLWQSHLGVVMCDGASVQLVSGDVEKYWDETNSDAIPADMIAESVGWYDTNLNAYKLLIASGVGQTTLNVELEFNLKTNEWTKIYRENSDGANQYQAGWNVSDTDGNTYSYGATSEGHVYRTENGTTWNGTAIEQYVWTKDLLLDGGFLNDTTATYFRLSFEKKDGTDLSYMLLESGDFVLTEDGDRIIIALGENIDISHYCNRELTVDGVNDQAVPASLDPNDGPIETPDVYLGPCLFHSFKLKSDITTLTDGFEPTGMGIVYDPQDTISQE